MKKILFAATMFAASLSASAQYEPGTFSLKPKLGFGISTITNMDDINVPIRNNYYEADKSVNVGFHGGVEFEYQVKKWLGLAAGLDYTRQGIGWETNKVKIDGIKYENFNNSIDLGYINLPIVANFYVVKGLALKTGLQFGFLTDAHQRYDVRTTDKKNHIKIEDLTKFSQNIYEDCNKVDLAIPVGISYEFKHHFTIDARYNIGLLKVNKDEFDYDETHRNGSFQMTFGWKFRVGRH